MKTAPITESRLTKITLARAWSQVMEDASTLVYPKISCTTALTASV
jgi:hypothetical protein